MPFLFEAAILSRIRSPVTSRSNWAKEKDVQGQSSHAGRGVERLGDRDERHSMGVEELDQLGEVGERAGQPVDLVDNDHVDPVSANVIKELLERWPVHRAARVATVVVAGPDQLPALMSLALDVGFRRLPLIVERVELLLQAMLSRDAGVDGAAQYRFASLRFHGEAACRLGRRAKAAPPSLIGLEAAASDKAASQSPDLRGTIPDRSDLAVRKPKKRWPFQLVPVIALATCDRLAIGLAVPGDALVEDHHTLEPAIPFAGEQRPGLQLGSFPRCRNPRFERMQVR
jgi:hypothetical protein